MTKMILLNKLRRIKTRFDYRKFIFGKYKANLTGEYKSLFRHLKFKKIKLLELGVEWGGSLMFWSDFFLHPGTRMIGLDIKLPFGKTFPRRVTVAQCDQNDSVALKNIAEQYGPFDIIIDDASHFAKETENSFNTLLHYVKPGGYYIIEDWSVGYMGKEFAGMNDLIANIVSRAPHFDIESLRVIYNNSTLAVFKGSTAIFRKNKK
jgi:cephalosporin hydroxylase